MTCKYLKLYALGAFLLTSTNLLAQDSATTFTIDKAIATGLEHNKKLQIQRGILEVDKWKTKAIQKEQLPNIEFHSGFNVLSNLLQFEDGVGNKATAYHLPRYQYDFTLKAEIPIYEGGKILNHQKSQQLQTEIQEQRIHKSERMLRLEIITAFLNVVHIENQKSLILEKIKEDSAVIAQTKHLIQNGLVTDNELLRTQLQLSNHQITLSDLEKDIQIVAAQLKPVLGIASDEPIYLNTEGWDQKTLSFENANGLYEIAMRNSESLKMAALEKQHAQIEQKIVKANVLPTLATGGEYGYSYPNFKFFPPVDYLYRFGLVGVKLKVPISNFYKNKEKMQMAKIAISNAHLEEEEVLEQLKADVDEAKLKYLQASEKIALAEEAKNLAEENFRIVKKKYANQLSLITELIDADNAYLEARSRIISLKVDQQLKYYQLQYRLGNI